MLGRLLDSSRQAFLPFLDWITELRHRPVIIADVTAGLTVALVLIPQSMAYAQLAGLPPYVGLYAAFLPPIISALFGSSRQLATGPVAIVSLMTASALQPLASANPEGFLAYAALLALLVGIFQISLGMFRLGVLVDFLSHPVVIGFTNAAALIIASSQMAAFFGVSVEPHPQQYMVVWHTALAAWSGAHFPTMMFGCLAVILILGLKYIVPPSPITPALPVLTAVIVTTVVSYLIGFEGMGGNVVGNIPNKLPAFGLPTFRFDVVVQMIASASVIALVGFVEAISIAKSMAAESRQKIDANQELIGQGLSNVTASLFHAYPVSGSISRSAVNFEAGAQTGFSSIITGLTVAITLLLLTPLLYHLPQATLATIIIVAVLRLIRFKPIEHAWKVEKHDGVVALVTFALTLLFAPHIERGLLTGLLLSLVLFVYRTMRPRIVEISMHDDGTLRDVDTHNLKTSTTVAVVRMDMSLYFANAGYLEDKILNLVAERPVMRYLIIDAQSINTVDATGEEMLSNLSERLKTANIDLMIARANAEVSLHLRSSGLLEHLGDYHFFRRVRDALDYIALQLDEPHTIDCLRFSHKYLNS